MSSEYFLTQINYKPEINNKKDVKILLNMNKVMKSLLINSQNYLIIHQKSKVEEKKYLIKYIQK